MYVMLWALCYSVSVVFAPFVGIWIWRLTENLHVAFLTTNLISFGMGYLGSYFMRKSREVK